MIVDYDSSSDSPQRGKLRVFAMVVALVAIVLVVFGPVTRGSFLIWDDWEGIGINPDFNPTTVQSVIGQFTHLYHSIYIPVTSTLWAAMAAVSPRSSPDVQGITLSAPLFHSINLALHAISAVLAFIVLRQLTRRDWPAFLAAVLFAVHPVMVEPVAWMSGAKDVLCGVFCLAAISQYTSFRSVDRPSGRAMAHYIVGLLLFALAMLAKPAAVSLPVVLFAIAVGLLDRRTCDTEAQRHREENPQKDIASRLCAFLCASVPLCRMLPRIALRTAIELLPWLVLAVPIVLIGKLAQPAPNTADVAIWQRPFVAGDAIAFYLGKIAWPATLIFDYGRNPPWLLRQGGLMYLTSAVAVIVIVAAWLLRKRFPASVVGIGVLVGAVLPVLGLVRFDFQWYSTVADHYLYLAMLGPAIVLAFALRRWGGAIAYIACGVVLLGLAMKSYSQITYWRDMPTLRDHELAVNPISPTGYRVAAYFANRAGDQAEAIRQYELALSTRPDDFESHYDLANLLLRLNTRLAEAAEHYQIALDKMPDDPKVPNNLGIAQVRLGQYEQAATSFAEAVRRDPAYADGHANLGRILLMAGRLDQAAAEFQAALAIDPNHAMAKKGLADVAGMR